MAATHRQSFDDIGVSSTTVAVTLASDVLAGSVIAVAIHAVETGLTISSVVDTLSNTYTYAGDNPTSGSDNGQMWGYYAKNVSAGTCTITATFSGTASLARLYASEAIGCDTTAPLDQHDGNFQSNAGTGTDGVTSQSAGQKTTTTDGQFIFGCTNGVNVVGFTAGTSFTERRDNTVGACESLDQSTQGNIAATFTCDASFDNNATILMTFKAAGGGATLWAQSVM